MERLLQSTSARFPPRCQSAWNLDPGLECTPWGGLQVHRRKRTDASHLADRRPQSRMAVPPPIRSTGARSASRAQGAHYVNANSIKCKCMDCVEVCPVDCFHEGENMVVIHSDECIDCAATASRAMVSALRSWMASKVTSPFRHRPRRR